MESEFFGHEKGAFTGATQRRLGRFMLADQGTIFLDEIGELPLELQPKLLRALQYGEIQRVGSDRVHRVDVRVIAATNRSLEREVAEGRFRADLYHRLAVFPLRVPSLGERREDIAQLAAHFADSSGRRLGLGRVKFSERALGRLVDADWPGNVRELENVVSRAVLRAAAGVERHAAVTVEEELLDVAPAKGSTAGSHTPEVAASPAGAALRDLTGQFQRRVIVAAVERRAGNWAAAARDLGLHRSNLHQLARRLGLR
jgi:anaerobic nitric oxide reductase transcription regulator